ncbi:MAG: T9SS type A sorting domain-containing protein [Bacteroidia bacterium]|nr:T9SS type A sorting domain-containing protein [Bacteroidia bacterium]MDG2042001.1 T9SS type A sorting domain-containing protein [Bacteroidia bacterium]|tara:strand:- start:924 stop:1676 length:753 start_codon:yes stop_codon:yes gene_type:complete
MKKIFTLLLIALTSLSFAQVDWAIKSIIEPTELESNTSSGTPIPVNLECENRGTSTIFTGDTVIYNLLMIDLKLSQVIAQIPNGFYYQVITEDIPVGGTFNIINENISLGSYPFESRDVRLGATSYIMDRTSPYLDSDSSNNSTFVDITWWNPQRWNVSVEDVKYNSDNIAVYPNPANDQLNVRLLFAESNAVNIELFDLTGKVVASPNRNQAISPNQYTIDVADLSKGVYILKVTNGTKVSTSKVTISH